MIGTWGFGEQTPEQLKNDPAAYKIHGPGLERLSKLGVPVVQAAGNRATQGNREDINHRPAIFMDDTKIPLIVVGAVGFDGHPWVGSQGQDQLGVDKPLTIYAPGVDVVCQDRENGKQFPSSGTSWGMFLLCLNTAEFEANYLYQLPHRSLALSRHTSRILRTNNLGTARRASNALSRSRSF